MNFPAALAATALACLAALVAAPSVRAQPPAWPDARALANGCYISTAVYLGRLRAQHPLVSARTETVRLPAGRLHTIAVIEWEGQTYLRDQFIGVAPLRGDVQLGFERAVAAWRARGGRHTYPVPAPLSSAQRLAEVAAAAKLLAAERPEVLCIPAADGAIPVLAWKTPAGELALYDPASGTAVGVTERTPAAVALQLFGLTSRPDSSANRHASHREAGAANGT